MTITPPKPSFSRRRPVTIGRDWDAIRRRVERGIARVREHHERRSLGDRRAERDQIAVDRHANGCGSRRRCSRSPRRGRGSASRWPPRVPSRSPRIEARVRAAIPRSSPAKERVTITEPGRGTSATGARFTCIPAARSCRPAPAAARRTLRGGPWNGWLAAGARVAHGPDVAALLIHHHERPAARGALKRACEARATRRGLRRWSRTGSRPPSPSRAVGAGCSRARRCRGSSKR